MSPEERIRHETYRRFAEAAGQEAADYLMAHLPPEEWPGLATKADLRELGAEIRKDMAHQFEVFQGKLDSMESRWNARFGSMDARFDSTDARIDSKESKSDARFESVLTKIDSLHQVMVERFSAADANMRSYVDNSASTLRREMINQTRTMVIAIATMMVALVAAFAR